MSATVLVVCRDCAGSGDGPDGYCGWCKAQGHILIDRTIEGDIPEGYVEWIRPLLPPTPENPLVLSHVPRCC
jgi:DnaJ-class molecular chaperone